MAWQQQRETLFQVRHHRKTHWESASVDCKLSELISEIRRCDSFARNMLTHLSRGEISSERIVDDQILANIWKQSMPLNSVIVCDDLINKKSENRDLLEHLLGFYYFEEELPVSLWHRTNLYRRCHTKRKPPILSSSSSSSNGKHRTNDGKFSSHFPLVFVTFWSYSYLLFRTQWVRRRSVWLLLQFNRCIVMSLWKWNAAAAVLLPFLLDR